MLPLRDADRVKVLSAVARTGAFYRTRRVAAITASLAILVVIPLTELVRLDLWGGQHRLLGEAVDAVTGVKGFVVAMGVLYSFTFITNMLVGRFFCGWGCPVGYVSRVGEEVRVRGGKTRFGKIRQHVLGAGFVGTFVAAIMLWWVDPRVLLDGSAQARWTTLGIFVGLSAGGFLHAFYWQFAFCRNVCPVGVYYRFVTSRAPVGIVFDKLRNVCIECGSCERVCPVDLDPKTFGEEDAFAVDSEGAVARDNDAECLRCGDCVEACSMVFSKKPGLPAPLRFGMTRKGSGAVVPPAPAAPDACPL